MDVLQHTKPYAKAEDIDVCSAPPSATTPCHHVTTAFRKHQETKLAHAVGFFSRNTLHANRAKVIGLLFLFDFEHFAQTGLSVTGLEYSASGSMPVSDGVAEAGRVKVDMDVFTPREVTLMERIAEVCRTAQAHTLIQASELMRSAGALALRRHGARPGVIPYALGISDDHPRREAIFDTAEEYSAYFA
jgi:hypothetical protein